MNLAKLLLYFNTVKHLKLRQFIFNFIRRFSGNQKIAYVDNVSCHSLNLIASIVYKNKIDNESVCFLNQKRSFEYIIDWACMDEPKLWRYNLHYFDFLLDDGAPEQVKDKLINDWITISHGLKEDAWEPYPVSLRIVNWVKYFIKYKNNNVPDAWLVSLAQQAHVLYHSIEYHILANHYLKNGKGLFFAGAYLNVDYSSKWFDKGKVILIEEAEEQILNDGGHYEKSPMYHSILVEDYLDVINLISSNSLSLTSDELVFLTEKTTKALSFLNTILMPDSDIPLFNDSAFKITPHPDEIFQYAQKVIGYERPEVSNEKEITALTDSGYFIIRNKNSQCVIDCGSISPEYQPGHTHCDLLSYELSIKGHRVVVDTGLHDYEGSEDRVYARSTKAHNTIEIDNKEQSEVWGQFRVARRAKVLSSRLYTDNGMGNVFEGSYKPYWASADNIIHSRKVINKDNVWTINDEVLGSGSHSVKNYIHFHPDIEILNDSNKYLLVKHGVNIAELEISDGFDCFISDGYYYPEFGKKYNSKVMIMSSYKVLPAELEYSIKSLIS